MQRSARLRALGGRVYCRLHSTQQERAYSFTVLIKREHTVFENLCAEEDPRCWSPDQKKMAQCVKELCESVELDYDEMEAEMQGILKGGDVGEAEEAPAEPATLRRTNAETAHRRPPEEQSHF